MNTYPFEVEIYCAAMSKSIEYDMIAEFDYSPEEPRTYDDPGCPEEIEVVEIKSNNLKPSPIELLLVKKLNDCDFDQLEDEILQNREDMINEQREA